MLVHSSDFDYRPSPPKKKDDNSSNDAAVDSLFAPAGAVLKQGSSLLRAVANKRSLADANAPPVEEPSKQWQFLGKPDAGNQPTQPNNNPNASDLN